ncbi:MAG: hypothetical protein V7735_12460 [Photobacterium frigidiphilum]
MSTAILITGCSTGIGYHCAMHFIKRVIKLPQDARFSENFAP